MTNHTKKEAFTIAGSLIGLWIANKYNKSETAFVLVGGFVGAFIAHEVFNMTPNQIKN